MTTMYLHPEVRLPLPPGRYRLDVSHELDDDVTGGSPLPTRSHHLVIDVPRVRMDGTEVFAVSPPPNALGPFGGRLAQITLRRRALPWARSGDTGPPWLALIVLAEGEGELLTDVPVREAFTDGVYDSLPERPAADVKADTLEVVQSVLNRVFPAREELELTAHVRHVPTADTEYADEDGWVAVVIANRLPLPGIRYRAHLISVEGQHAALPPVGRVASEIPMKWAIGDKVTELIRTRGVESVPASVVDFVRNNADALKIDLKKAGLDRTIVGEAPTAPIASFGVVSPVAADLLAAVAEIVELERRYRFPVLAHWEFECSDDGRDFSGYMANLDVGMIGAPAPGPTTPEVAATGHLALDHTDRQGMARRSWYRGPLSPAAITRAPAGAPAHVADQLLAVTEDGRFDTSYASAFEIGRLLAMSDLQFLRWLRAYARAGFVNRRLAELHGAQLRDLVGHVFDPDRFRLDVEMRRIVERSLVPGGLGGDPREALGPPLAIHDGPAFVDPAAQVPVLARGFGLEVEVVRGVLDAGATTVAPPVADAGVRGFDDVVAGGVTADVEALRDQGVALRLQAIETVIGAAGGAEEAATRLRDLLEENR